MKLTKAQKKMLCILALKDCVVYILVPIRSWSEHAFYGNPYMHKGKPRPSTIHALVKKGLIKKIEGPYGTAPEHHLFNSSREGKYGLADLGKQIAEELREKQNAETD